MVWCSAAQCAKRVRRTYTTYRGIAHPLHAGVGKSCDSSRTTTHPPADTEGTIPRAGKRKIKHGRELIMVIDFFMVMKNVPTVTHQEKQVHVVNGKPVFYEPADLKAARQKLMDHLAGHKPEQPYQRGIRLMVKWCFPRGKHANGEYRITKPDTDNLQKLLKDCMTVCGFWKDDAQVASEIVEKFWADVPGIYVRIEEL